MAKHSGSAHKRERSKIQYFREFTLLFRALTRDEPSFASVYPTRIDGAPDGSVLYIYFAGSEGEEAVEAMIGKLILYKPSFRKALSQQVQARYTPQLVFKYDATFEKIQRIEKLLEEIAPSRVEHAEQDGDKQDTQDLES